MLELMEDLGKITRTSDSSKSDAWGMYKCTCGSITKIRSYDVARGHTTVCKACAIIEGARKRIEGTRAKIIARFITIHMEKYDYSKFIYINAKTKGIVICKVHGEFLITPNNHLNGYGCKECGRITMIAKQSAEAKDSFYRDIERIHSDKLQVECHEYINTHTKVSAKCLVDYCSHTFMIEPAALKSGRGCPKCGYRRIAQTASFQTHKHNYSTACTLYLIEFSELGLYKLGITNRTIVKRYENEKQQYNEVFTLELPIGALAYAVEQQLLKYYIGIKYRGEKLLVSGNSECLVENPKDFAYTVESTVNNLKDTYGC